MYTKNIIALTILSASITSNAMQLTIQKNKDDYFSQQPNFIKRQIIFPILEDYPDYKDIKNSLMTLSLVSKKSYEQTNCIFFTTHMLHELSSKFDQSTAAIALKLNTPGTRKYNDLGRALYLLSINHQTKKYVYIELKQLINKGVDLNYQTAIFNTTALMKAVEKANKHLVCHLIQKGANINTKSLKGYVREHSIIYNPFLLKNYVHALACLLEKKQKKSTPTKLIHDTIYSHPLGRTIRRAIAIDEYLRLRGALLSEKGEALYSEHFTPLYSTIPSAWTIVHYITSKPSTE